MGSANAPIQVEKQPQAAHVANEEDVRAAAVDPKDPPLQGQVEHEETLPKSSSSSPTSAASSFMSAAETEQGGSGLDP